MSRKAVLLTALIASVGAGPGAYAADAALFSNAGQLSAGKAMLAEGGIAGLSGSKADGSFAAQQTVTFAGGDLFAAAPSGAAVTFADPALVAKMTAAVTGERGAATFARGGAAGLTGGDAQGSGVFASGTAAGLDGGAPKDGTFSGGGAVGLTGSDAQKDGTYSAGGAAGLTGGDAQANGTFSAGGAASLDGQAGPLGAALAARAALMSLSK